jgi:hypothetical protein
VATTHAPAALQVQLHAGDPVQVDLQLDAPSVDRRPAHSARSPH